MRRAGVALLFATIAWSAGAAPANYVIHISVDGLRPDAITSLGPMQAPNFYRLRKEGAFTDNARTDPNSTITLPNHTSMLVGRTLDGDKGHGYSANGMPRSDMTLHSVHGAYVRSVMDAVHDNGMRTSFFVTKEKFVLFDTSYSVSNGAPDVTGDDNGRDKIDTYRFFPDSEVLINEFIAAMRTRPFHYSFVHLHDPDAAGHGYHWDLAPDSAYLGAVKRVDSLIGRLLNAISLDLRLATKTTIIVTADHGGRIGTIRHEPADDPENFIVPFYTWGRGVAARAELYELNPTSRRTPGKTNPPAGVGIPPIRAADSANLALQLLGLPALRDSNINPNQDLRIGPRQ